VYSNQSVFITFQNCKETQTNRDILY